MNYIKITVREKRAKCNGRERIVCGNSDYVIKFDFDDEWAAYDTKTARFVSDGGKYTDVQFTGDEVGVPVLRDTRTVSVGCYAGDIRTTTAALIQAVPCCTDPDGTPAAQTPRRMCIISSWSGLTPPSGQRNRALRTRKRRRRVKISVRWTRTEGLCRRITPTPWAR